jgi:hypothetical protein
MDIAVVPGSYPEPFLHAGPTSVVGAAAVARPIARQVHGRVTTKPTLRSAIVIGGGLPPDFVRIAPHGHGYELDLGAEVARRLAADPTALRFRF